jgi:hypothetical protein
LLFFSSGLADHRIASITLLAVHKNDAGLWILGNRILRTREGTGRIFTMVAKQGFEIGSPLDRLDHFRADTNSMFLFASHFTGMATHAFIFVQHQSDLSHLYLLSVYPIIFGISLVIKSEIRISKLETNSKF